METITRTKVRNFINNTWKTVSNSRFHDEDWSGFHSVIKYLQDSVDFKFGKDNVEISYFCENGGYRESKDGMSLWKEYIIKVYFKGKQIIKGYINCCACGTIQNPFSTYDMVFVNWLESENN